MIEERYSDYSDFGLHHSPVTGPCRMSQILTQRLVFKPLVRATGISEDVGKIWTTPRKR